MPANPAVLQKKIPRKQKNFAGFYFYFIFVRLKQYGFKIVFPMILAGFGKKKSRNIYVNIKTNDMKNRLLPFSLIPVFAGLFFLIFSVLLMAGQPGNPDLGKF